MFDRPLKILLVSSEVVPFAKTGGLADVAGSLPKALATVGNDNLGNDVRVAMPHYKGIEKATYRMDFPVFFNSRAETAIIRESTIEAYYQGEHRIIPVYLVDNHHYFYRDGMYMFPDEAERFTFFCRAVLEMLPRLNWQPDIIHCNDWQTGPIPFFLKVRYAQDPFYSRVATVFTIHNLQYQGNFPKETLKLLGVGEEYFTPELLEFYGTVSYMKMGILYADVISTVSKTYAAEIQRPELGERMDGLLRKRSPDLYGIVNGINYHEFNPKTDPRIHRNYDQNSIENKKENKYALQKEMNLPVRDVPVLGMISRLVDQKGLDLIARIADRLLSHDLQFVVLGSGDRRYEDMFRDIHNRYPEKAAVYIGFNAILAQRIYAGADMFLMPSRFEPCGLGQLIAMRYGTIPIVRATGGLADTVHDFNPSTGSGNGFVFSEYEGDALYHAIQRALSLYTEHPHEWKMLIKRAMELDFSWARSAVEYLQLYQEALSRHLARAKTA
ncbi:glycogen synthase GlgA [Desulfofundulus sp. TPOSR]|uniref:Glycogen synthase n=1 Tax=Desulfofundulus kuznetsovii (strain DSM 6115 / VKM B-1805 / 17) TaxID=760568 RepID=A0AAU8PA16_DESK7|nr:glycogen synthase GlgA [Desulfofundulus sp. TPOSR]AEG14805.1 Glycogen synthase [Desulfofundulus kuznetsovii DSM 6115]NHM25729.1 glycogen synthase GlgA [Desulfofundulus sp. TPOSR]